MNIYLIEQTVNQDYDTYDSAVVVAETEEEARLIHPNGEDSLKIVPEESYTDWDWCKLADVKVTLLGTLADSNIKGVICASFNAG